jgi:Niemann-Pick C1 protein
MTNYMLILAVLLLCGNMARTQVAIRQKGYCVMYDVCPAGQQNPNCPYNGPAKSLPNDEAFKILSETCPALAKAGRHNTKTCCSLKQLHILKDQLQIAQQLMSRCPSCMKNFYKLWCEYTCSPDQSTFMDYMNMFGMAFSTLYISAPFANGLYDSCADVVYPGSNGKVLDLMCGTTDCNPQKFLDFIGQPGNAPFLIQSQINGTLPAENMTHMDPGAYHCDRGYVDPGTGRNMSACSCQDCQKSCPIPPAPTPPKPTRYIMGINEYYFVIGITCLGWLLLFWILNLVNVLREAKKQQRDFANRASSLGNYTSDQDTPPSTNGSTPINNLQIPHSPSTEGLCVVERKKQGRLVKLGIAFEDILQSSFCRWGEWVAYHPWTVIILSSIILIGLSLGLLQFTVVTDPVNLWSAPNSKARQDKDYFDETFSPFYRNEMVILTAKNESRAPELFEVYNGPKLNFTGMMHKDLLIEMIHLQTALMNIKAKVGNETVGLEDICFQPLYPDNLNCTVFSPTQYFQNNASKLNECWDVFGTPCSDNGVSIQDDWHTHLMNCAVNPTSMADGAQMKMPCMGLMGAPVQPKVVFGGFKEDSVWESQAAIMTFVVNNHKEKLKNAKAEAWEAEFIKYITDYRDGKIVSNSNLSIAFSTERSIQDELDRESASDVLTVLLSYILMFIYIAVALGQFKSMKRILVDAKLSVGLTGVMIVLLSVSASLGTFSYVGVPATLIIIEVVPFLVLAVGVDNIFILVQAVQQDNLASNEPVPVQIGRVLGQVGPSMLLSSLSECVAFAFGALSTMPAVNTFSIYAALAVGFNFLMQITILVAVVSLDCQRQNSNKYDIFCCCGLDKSDVHHDNGNCQGGILFQFMKRVFAPFILLREMRILIVTVFSILLACSIAVIPKIEVGLDQTLALPDDSYLMDYFNDLNTYMKTGAPVYFVIKDSYEYSKHEKQNKICGISGCQENSIIGDVFVNSMISERSAIALPASSWLDDYIAWMDPSGTCCRILDYKIETNGSKVYPRDLTFCDSMAPKNWVCHSCMPKARQGQRPTPSEFKKYLSWFLKDNPNTVCAKGGHPAYGSAVKLNVDPKPSEGKYLVGSSYFMSYHTVAAHPRNSRQL